MDEKKSFLLRIDAGLWNELQAWAGDELRSVNGQVEYILREAVKVRRRKRDSEAGPGRPSAGGR
ncbi:MAG: Arc family DNA-binding protein [Elusimicrobia bacterium]|nr:Arc family DNA-binding protein [Elusimicrobiota bacterium]